MPGNDLNEMLAEIRRKRQAQLQQIIAGNRPPSPVAFGQQDQGQGRPQGAKENALQYAQLGKEYGSQISALIGQPSQSAAFGVGAGQAAPDLAAGTFSSLPANAAGPGIQAAGTQVAGAAGQGTGLAGLAEGAGAAISSAASSAASGASSAISYILSLL